MIVIKTHARINRRIRHLRKISKIANNEAKAYRAEAEYYQTLIDNIYERFDINPYY